MVNWIIALIVCFIIGFVALKWRHREKNSDFIMPLMDENTAKTPESEISSDPLPAGCWGDQVIGKPRVIAVETEAERIARIHQVSRQWQHVQEKYTAPRQSTEAGFKRSTPSAARHVQGKIIQKEPAQVIGLYVMAKPGSVFKGYALYQSLIDVGLVYGKMKIFHFHAGPDCQSPVLFSVASAINPGIIHVEEMSDFQTPGLSLFLDSTKVAQPKIALERMIAVAEKLADRLHGVVLNQDKTPWSTETEEACYARFE